MDSFIPISQIALQLVTRPESVKKNKISIASDVVHPHEHNSTVRSLTSPFPRHLRESLDEQTMDIHRRRGHLYYAFVDTTLGAIDMRDHGQQCVAH